ncbi:hypothetical protein A9K97_gp294 [Tokyovirus A1]|uniref:hypothetical protein n=1 Tax=Tokyovirus A1 TaxID=1826170 RepID=UPI0007A96C38|nr:hypothetical protein A9K97_gp294 [Tokyovirus A1]BAU80057.1 hypothetical protein [Tokyovirus A1]
MGHKKLTDEQLADALQRIVLAKRKTERDISGERGDRSKLYRFLGELEGERALILAEMRRRQPQQYMTPR